MMFDEERSAFSVLPMGFDRLHVDRLWDADFHSACRTRNFQSLRRFGIRPAGVSLEVLLVLFDFIGSNDSLVALHQLR